MSATWWHYHALKSIEATGLNIVGLPQALRKVEKFFADHLTKDGGIGLSSVRQGEAYSQYTMTGPALSVLALARPTDRASVQGTKFILNELTKEPPDWSKNANLYCWYGTTLGLKVANPQAYKAWTAAVAPQLLDHQAEDGSWPMESSLYPVASTSAAGADAEIYRICLCILTLEAMGK